MIDMELSEKVLNYRRAQLDAWRRGDKSLIPRLIQVHDTFFSQASYHFGEVFVLRHYHETERWLGLRWYALGAQCPRSTKRATVEEGCGWEHDEVRLINESCQTLRFAAYRF